MIKVKNHEHTTKNRREGPVLHIHCCRRHLRSGDFSLPPRSEGQAGSPIFFPKDDTPGCTTQACGIRDSWKAIKSTGASLFGISIDPVEAHEKFIAKFDLPFPLLADTDKSIVKCYGVWVEKSMYGKKYMGTERTTYVIDSNGIIVAIFPKVKPAEHAELVLEALDTQG